MTRDETAVPNCHTCGRFHNALEAGASWRMVPCNPWWEGIDHEDSRCADCTRRLGPLAPLPGMADNTAGII